VTKEFRPYGARIVVQKITEQERSGLIVPRQAQKRALIGKVLHVGPDVTDIKPGEVVLFAQYSGCTPYLDSELQARYGEDIVVMNGEDILCFIDEASAAFKVVA
jgi:chaperonin GroES